MSYPAALARLVGRGIVHLEPWFVLDAELARARLHGLRTRYPDAQLLPFARREDNDDVACFDRELPGRVVIINDFASAGTERRETFEDFYGWLRRAVEDMIEYDEQEGRDVVTR